MNVGFRFGDQLNNHIKLERAQNIVYHEKEIFNSTLLSNKERMSI